MSVNKHSDESNRAWSDYCIGLKGESIDDVTKSLVETFRLDTTTLISRQDLVRDTAELISGGDSVDEAKVRRRLGLDYGSLSLKERELLRVDVSKMLPEMFEECERAGHPLVAIVGYGSHFDLRMGLSELSDLDLKVIPLRSQDDGTHACWQIIKKYKDFELRDGYKLLEIDAYSDWLTGVWLQENLSKIDKLERMREQFKYVKPGSVVVARNKVWADLLNRTLDLESKGIVITILEYE